MHLLCLPVWYENASGGFKCRHCLLTVLQGASAILDYNTIQSPLAQPRAAIVGTAVAATSGVAVTKLFMLRSDFESIRWIAGAASCGIASSLMTLTNSIHPPGGATALLAAVDPTVSALGWMLIPLILLSTVLMLSVALLVNNIQRQYPIYWWSSKAVGRRDKDEEERIEGEIKSSSTEDIMESIRREHLQDTVIIGPDHVVLPKGFTLGLEEIDAVDTIRDWLRDVAKQGHESSSTSLSGRYGR
jgi:CBS-domain-containing membrane protein